MHFLLGAEDQPDWRVLAVDHPVLARVVEVEVHLACVGMCELVELQVDDHEAAQSPMEEQQVDPVPSAANPQPTLPTDEREVAAELEEERL